MHEMVMPLATTKVVLDAKPGSGYDDVVASRYHFPLRYRRTVLSAVGGWAVFRRPRDGGEGIAYFGVGRIVEINPDRIRPRKFYAKIEDYLPFPTPVPWKVNGRYFERALREVEDVSKIGVLLRGRSARPLEDKDFVTIVDKGMREIIDSDNLPRYWNESMPTFETEMDPVRRTEKRLMNRKVRDASFRKIVCEAYDDRCAVTRMRIINGGGRPEVQAAHIRPVSDGGPDLVQNGLALSATVHWLFDRYLISVDPEFRLLVAHNRVPAKMRGLFEQAMTRLHLPSAEQLYPNERFLAHHRKRFGEAA